MLGEFPVESLWINKLEGLKTIGGNAVSHVIKQ